MEQNGKKEVKFEYTISINVYIVNKISYLIYL